ncbi:MAG TPA: dihydrolipoamide acetyltransferase family protein [Bacillota bacterium]|nr:dihydrolipoamide acetyltransferase family protein [Bacillota bacterium]
MVKAVLMPKQGITVESCFLGGWNVKVGDAVSIGTVLFDYETDKAVFECPSEVEGTVLALLCQEGDVVPVLTPVCIIGAPGEDISDFAPQKKSEGSPALQSVPSEEPLKSSSSKTSVPISHDPNSPLLASPRAKKLAEKQNIDLRSVVPTGPKGRIVEIDVRDASLPRETIQPESEPDYVVEELPNIRKLIGRAMSESLSTMAQLTHTLSYDATDVLQFHASLKDQTTKDLLPKITLNDILLFAVSRVLKNYRDLNANLIGGTKMHYYNHMHIGIATDTPRGLVVPTLKNVDRMTLAEIATSSKELIAKAISGRIDPDLLKNGSFTISNLGTLDIEHFTPIINPPQTGILGVNTIMIRTKLDPSGLPVFYRAMGLSLTYDHRAIDGAGASRFLKELKEYLQTFSTRIAAEAIGLK